MAKGPKRHLKRYAAPESWNLNKEQGVFAIKPSSGPHKAKESIPLAYLLTKCLKYASNNNELKIILSGKQVKVNGRTITNGRFPVGIFDVVSIVKANEHFRLFYNVNQVFELLKIKEDEAGFKLSKVVRKYVEKGNGIPFVLTNEGFIYRFCDPKIEVNSTVKVDLKERKVVDYIPFTCDKVAFAYRGPFVGRIGVIKAIENNVTRDDTVYLTDFAGADFVSKDGDLIVIGEENNISITLLEERGIKLTDLQKSCLVYGDLEEEDSQVDEEE